MYALSTAQNVGKALNFIEIASSIQSNGGEILQKKRAYEGSSREPATELVRHSGNWMPKDEPQKALATVVITEEHGKADASSQVPDEFRDDDVVIWFPNQVFKNRMSRGDVSKGISPFRFCS